MRYFSAILFLQYLVQTLQSDQSEGSSTQVPENTTEITWRQILPESCGFRGWRLEDKLLELGRKTRSADDWDSTNRGGDNKVNNGQNAKITSHPWQVALVTADEKSFKCGGSIISKYHVLTASHCFLLGTYEVINKVKYDKDELVPYSKRLVVVGSTIFSESHLVYKIKELYIHNFYSLRHRRNDIALLKIDGEFIWSTSVFPICLPPEDEPYTAHRRCTVSGFGNLSPDIANRLDILQYGMVTISPGQYCKKYNEVKFGNITEGMFCASGDLGDGLIVDTCKGDSGGPLYCQKKSGKGQQVLLGITSFGHECGLMNYPGIYTKVSKYLQWIYDRVEVSLGHGYGHRNYLPEDVDVGRPHFVSNV